MSHDDDYRTPLPQLPVAGPSGVPNEVLDHRLKSVEHKFTELRILVDKNKEVLIETCGASGKDGKLKWIAERLSTIQAEIEELAKMFEEQRKFIYKVIVAMMLCSASGAGIAQVVIDMMGSN